VPLSWPFSSGSLTNMPNTGVSQKAFFIDPRLNQLVMSPLVGLGGTSLPLPVQSGPVPRGSCRPTPTH